MSARERLTAIWKKSRFDDDCETLDDYAQRVAERLELTYGTVIDNVTAETVIDAMIRHGVIKP